MYFWLLLAALIVSSQGEEIICTPRNFTSRHNNNTLIIEERFLKIDFNKDLLKIFPQPSVNRDVKLTLHNTYVAFLGKTYYENDESKRKNENLMESFIFKTNTVGMARLRNDSKNFFLADCDLYLVKSLKDSEKIPMKVKTEILHQAAACLSTLWCETKNSNISYSHLEIGGPTSSPNGNKGIKDDFKTSGPLQKLINKLVDVGLKKAGQVAMSEGREGYIKVPDFEEEFSFGHFLQLIKGKLAASNGTFGNVSTLTRTSDVELKQHKLDIAASFGIGLSKVNMTYRNYRLSHGFLKFTGHISVSIEGISISTTIFADYKERPCKMGLSKLVVNILGDSKVDITGLGYFNKITSQLASWIIKKSEDFVVNGGQALVRGIVEDKVLSKIDCEQFRP